MSQVQAYDFTSIAGNFAMGAARSVAFTGGIPARQLLNSRFMVENLITVSHAVWIRSPREKVFQFTQDYTKRASWDAGVIAAELVSEHPERIVKIRAAGNTTMVFVYKQYDPPRRTSLAAREVKSALIASGGGAWSYEEKDGGTLWAQTNSLQLKNSWFARLMRPLVVAGMRRQTVKSMEKAKRMLESGRSG